MKNIPDARLDNLLAVQREFYTTTVYRIDEAPTPGITGVAVGASGLAAGSSPSSWQGDRLILIRKQADIRLITVTLSVDGDRLKVDTHTLIVGEKGEKRESTVSELFDRVK